MTEIVNEGREADFNKTYMKYCDAEDFDYKGQIIPASIAKNLVLCKQMNGVEAKRIWEVASNIAARGLSITPYSASKIAKAEHEGKADQMLTYYKRKGFLKCRAGSEETKASLSEKFQREYRRVPALIQEFADACDFFKISEDDLIRSFRINQVRALKDSHLSGVQIALLLTKLDDKQISCLAENLEFGEMASDLIASSIRKNDINLENAAKWVADHTNSDPKAIRKIIKIADSIDFSTNPALSELKTKTYEHKYSDEVKKVEKAYKKCGFKLADCKCLLKKTTVRSGKYTARILEGDDPMQVILGKKSMGGVNCCQYLGEAGESSMMFGLTNDHAGFFAITETNTGEIKAIAEIWEESEDILVFDNIEFANDADISLYKDVLRKWLESSQYRSVAVGRGYNTLTYEDGFEEAPNFTPHVTAKDLYILSYEDEAEPEFKDHHDATKEECAKYMKLKSVEKAQKLMDNGEIDYYTYLYSDVDDGKGVSWLKKDGQIARYFFDDYVDTRNTEEEEDYDEEYEEG